MTDRTEPGGDTWRELQALAGQAIPGGVSDYQHLMDSSLLRLGGNSLSAITLAARAEDRLGVSVGVEALLADMPLGAVLSQALAAAPAATVRPRPPHPASGDSRQSALASQCSAVQRGMWLREKTFGAAPYNVTFVCFINGQLAVQRLRQALSEVVQRHEGLRTVFEYNSGKIERQILLRSPPELQRHQYRGRDEDFVGYARQYSAQLGARPFDVSTRPALRFALVSHGTTRHAFTIAFHHMLLDGWAVGLVMREIFGRYDAIALGEPIAWSPTVAFEHYLDLQSRLRASGELDRQAAFWRQHLAGAPNILEIPADRTRPTFQEPHGARVPFDLGHDLSGALRARVSEIGVTTAAFLLASFALALSRYTEATVLLVGVPVAARPDSRLEQLVAVTVNLVPVRVQIDDSQTCAEFLLAVQESLARSLDNSALPFGDLVAAEGLNGTSDRHPLVQVAFGMHDGVIPAYLETTDFDVTIEEVHCGGSQFDLELFIQRSSPSFAGELEYATSVWLAREAEAFCADLVAGIAELVSSASAPLESARCVAPHRRAMLQRMNSAARPLPHSSIDHWFRAQAGHDPLALAIRSGEDTLTYAELARAASAQARLLADAGVSPGDTVVIAAQRSIAEVVAALGVLWAGAAYAAVEPDMPPRRANQIIEVLRPAAAIGDALSPAGAGLAGRIPTVGCWPDLPSSGLGPLAPDPSRLAYVAFTSGSTGTPKGVSIPHRGVLRLVAGLADYAPMGAGDKMLRFASLSFDASTLEVWGALLTGATLEVHPAGVPSAAEIGRFISESGVTVGWLTAGLFRLVVEFAVDHLGAMKQLLTGGDVVSPEHVRLALRRHPGLVIVNGYGPTENTTFTTVHRMARPEEVDDPLPIGIPIANSQIYVLDQRRRLVPPGAPGELYVAGDGLAAGYFGAEKQSASAFGEFSPDVPARLYRTGDIVRLDTQFRLRFLGRRDDQVKINGYRVQLDEIHNYLMEYSGVSDAFVSVVQAGHADKQLLAACVPVEPGVAAADIIDFLSGRLPGYMIPALWAMVEIIPLTINGKVDRKALLQTARPAAHFYHQRSDAASASTG